MTPRKALDTINTILGQLVALRSAFHDQLNRADLVEAQACLEDVALRLKEDLKDDIAAETQGLEDQHDAP